MEFLLLCSAIHWISLGEHFTLRPHRHLLPSGQILYFARLICLACHFALPHPAKSGLVDQAELNSEKDVPGGSRRHLVESNIGTRDSGRYTR